MTAIYGVSLLVGVLLLVAWIAGTVVASSVEDREDASPDRRFGTAGRVVVAALCGFGMAGLSAEYGGWGTALAAVGALAGAVFLGTVAVVLGPDRSE